MRAAREQLPILFGSDPATLRGADWGELRCVIMSLPGGTDMAPLLRGLPNDMCPYPHWGYVIKGKLRVSYADSQEVIGAGDIYYLPPGHTASVEEDLECVEFSNPVEHERVLDVVKRNAGAVTA